jgi:hypothetical protein
MSKHASAKPIYGFHVVRIKRGVWIVPGVFTPDGDSLRGTLKQIQFALKQKVEK